MDELMSPYSKMCVADFRKVIQDMNNVDEKLLFFSSDSCSKAPPHKTTEEIRFQVALQNSYQIETADSCRIKQKPAECESPSNVICCNLCGHDIKTSIIRKFKQKIKELQLECDSAHRECDEAHRQRIETQTAWKDVYKELQSLKRKNYIQTIKPVPIKPIPITPTPIKSIPSKQIPNCHAIRELLKDLFSVDTQRVDPIPELPDIDIVANQRTTIVPASSYTSTTDIDTLCDLYPPKDKEESDQQNVPSHPVQVQVPLTEPNEIEHSFLIDSQAKASTGSALWSGAQIGMQTRNGNTGSSAHSEKSQDSQYLQEDYDTLKTKYRDALRYLRELLKLEEEVEDIVTSIDCIFN